MGPQVISTNLEVRDGDGELVPSQLVPLTQIEKDLRDQYVNAYEGVSPAQRGPLSFLVFQASVPPLGFSTFHVKTSAAGSRRKISCSCIKTEQLAIVFVYSNFFPISIFLFS